MGQDALKLKEPRSRTRKGREELTCGPSTFELRRRLPENEKNDGNREAARKRSKAEKECFEEKKRRKRRRRVGGGGRRRLLWWPASIQDGGRSRVRAEEEK